MEQAMNGQGQYGARNRDLYWLVRRGRSLSVGQWVTRLNTHNMAKKIEVWVNEIQVRRGGDGYDCGQIITKVYEPTHENGDEDWNAKATLVIGDERVFTESEVRAVLEEVLRKESDGDVAPGWHVKSGDIYAAFKKHGITLDPA